MATYASYTGGSGNFDPVPEGPHPAVCDMFVDLGLQESSGKFGSKVQHKIYLRWQIPSLRLSYEKDGVTIDGPMTIGAKYTLSLHEKANLRHILKTWRGRDFTPEELKRFDVTTILGAPCIVSVSHAPKDGGGVYANIDAVMKLMPGMEAPKLEGSPLLYDADNLGTFEQLRPWLQEIIKGQKELEAVGAGNSGGDDWRRDLDDEVPF